MKTYNEDINVNEPVNTQSVIDEPASASDRYDAYVRSQNVGPTEWLQVQLTTRDAVNRIIKDVAAAAGTGVTVADVMGRSRYAEIVAVRHKAMAEVYAAFPWMSYPQMGRLFGRDHSTCMHALQKMGVLKPRQHGGGGGGCSVAARTYGHKIDFLFVRIGAALSASTPAAEGATHETA